MQKISKFNGSELELALEDVQDHVVDEQLKDDGDDENGEEHTPFISSAAKRARPDARILFDAAAETSEGVSTSETEPLSDGSANGSRTDSRSSERTKYNATGSSEVPLDSHTFATPSSERLPYPFPTSHADTIHSGRTPPLSPEPKVSLLPKAAARPRIERSSAMDSTPSRRSSFYEAKARVCWALPSSIRRPLWAWLDKIVLVLSPEWKRTTLLVWAMWCSMSLGEDTRPIS